MTPLLDFLIEATTLASAAYLGLMFVAGLSRRPRPVAAAVPVEAAPADAPTDDLPAVLGGEFCSDETAREAAHVEAFLSLPVSPAWVDNVVPFIRPVRPAQRPAPTDRELIELAKSTDYPGAKKWSYSRKLNQRQKESLLKVWEVIAA